MATLEGRFSGKLDTVISVASAMLRQGEATSFYTVSHGGDVLESWYIFNSFIQAGLSSDRLCLWIDTRVDGEVVPVAGVFPVGVMLQADGETYTIQDIVPSGQAYNSIYEPAISGTGTDKVATFDSETIVWPDTGESVAVVVQLDRPFTGDIPDYFEQKKVAVGFETPLSAGITLIEGTRRKAWARFEGSRSAPLEVPATEDPDTVAIEYTGEWYVSDKDIIIGDVLLVDVEIWSVSDVEPIPRSDVKRVTATRRSNALML